jgi:dihydroorotase-like cyclic amidohydrolase
MGSGGQVRGRVGHYIHMGLTEELEQVSVALHLAKHWEEQNFVRAVKVYWVDSTGNMGIKDHGLQRRIWEIAGARGVDYQGVVMQHLEDEEKFDVPFDFRNPVSHSYRQHEGAELACAVRQVRNAYDSGFTGTFYACHVSSPDTIEFLNSERGCVPCETVIETTGHHEFLNFTDYDLHGNRVKVNPPLRSVTSQERVLEAVIDHRTDIIGDDHAPHPLARKISENPPSGIHEISFLPKRVELLRGLGIGEEHLEELLFGTANGIFGLGLEKQVVDVEYIPSLWEKYEMNLFSRVDGTL